MFKMLKEACLGYISGEFSHEAFVDMLDGFASSASEEELKIIAEILSNELLPGE